MAQTIGKMPMVARWRTAFACCARSSKRWPKRWARTGTGVRLSPNGLIQGCNDSDPEKLFVEAARVLQEAGIAYLEMREPGERRHLWQIRPSCDRPGHASGLHRADDPELRLQSGRRRSRPGRRQRGRDRFWPPRSSPTRTCRGASPRACRSPRTWPALGIARDRRATWTTLSPLKTLDLAGC